MNELPDMPEELQAACVRAGGLTWRGEALYRVILGRRHLSWVCGQFTDYDGSGNKIRTVIDSRYEPLYVAYGAQFMDGWLLEKWIPAEEFAGSRESWETLTRENVDGQTVRSLGPYPAEGEYQLCINFGPRRPSIGAVEKIIRVIEASRLVPKAQSAAAIRRREEKLGTDYESWAYDILDDGVAAMHGQPFVTVAG